MDTSKYNIDELKSLKDKIDKEIEVRKGEVEQPYYVTVTLEPPKNPDEGGFVSNIRIYPYEHSGDELTNLWQRLRAEAKLRKYGGGSFIKGVRDVGLLEPTKDLRPRTFYCDGAPPVGCLFFESQNKALAVYQRLNKEEKQALIRS